MGLFTKDFILQILLGVKMKKPEITTSKSDLYINALYESLLGRAADLGGLTEKSARLDSGKATVKDITQEILASEEFRVKLPTFFNKFSDNGLPLINSVSQFGETELLIKHWVSDATTVPIVVDVGARGKERSNSWDLLNSFGWRGLLIEANSLLIPQIEREFGGLDYKLINCAISDYEGKAKFTLGVNDDVSSLEAKAAEAWGTTKGTVDVKVRRLQSVLKGEDISYNFFLLSLDIEGEDIKVFNDLIANSEYRPSYVVIEASYDFSTKSLDDIPVTEKVKKLYRLVNQTKANLILKLIGK